MTPAFCAVLRGKVIGRLGRLWMPGMLLGVGLTPSARGAKPGKLLHESGRWGDGRFVAGDLILSKAFSAGRLAVAVSRGVIVWDVGTLPRWGEFPSPSSPESRCSATSCCRRTDGG